MAAPSAPGWWDLKAHERRRALRLAKRGEADPDPVVADAADAWATGILRSSAIREFIKHAAVLAVAVVALYIAVHMEGGYLPLGLLVIPAALIVWTSWSERRRARRLRRVSRPPGRHAARWLTSSN